MWTIILFQVLLQFHVKKGKLFREWKIMTEYQFKAFFNGNWCLLNFLNSIKLCFSVLLLNSALLLKIQVHHFNNIIYGTKYLILYLNYTHQLYLRSTKKDFPLICYAMLAYLLFSKSFQCDSELHWLSDTKIIIPLYKKKI